MVQRPIAEDQQATTAVQEYDVEGVSVARPFKIRRLGHVGLSFEDLAGCYKFYHDSLGLRTSDRIDWSQRIPEKVKGLGDPFMYFTRCASDHHSLVFLSRAIRNAAFPVDDPLLDIQQISAS